MSSCEFDMLRRCGARYVLHLRLCVSVSHFKLRRRSDYKLPGRRRRRGEEEEARVDSSFGGKRRRHKKGGGGVFTSFLGSPRGLKQWRKGGRSAYTKWGGGKEECKLGRRFTNSQYHQFRHMSTCFFGSI